MEYRTFAYGAVNTTYRYVFHKDLSKDAVRFIKNLSFVLTGTIPSIALLSIFNILAARTLGPAEYGKYTLIQSIAVILETSMVMGNHTAIAKFLPEASDEEKRRGTISSVYLLTLLLTLGSVAVYLLFAPQLSQLFHTSEDFFGLAVLFGAIYAFYVITTNTVRGLLRMKLYSMFQVMYAMLTLGAFLAFILISPTITYQSVLYPVFIAYGITGLLIIMAIRKYLIVIFDKRQIFLVAKYSFFCAIGGIGYTIYSNISSILINANLTPTDLGVYGAYSLAAISVTSLLVGTFITVFFPTASRQQNKEEIFAMFGKALPFIVILGIPFLVFCEFIILYLYGSRYPLYLDLVLLFSAAGVCQSVQHLYGWILTSDSKVGVKINSTAAIVMAIVLTGLSLYLIPALGIRGPVLAMILSYIVVLMFEIVLKRRFFRSGDAVAGN